MRTGSVGGGGDVVADWETKGGSRCSVATVVSNSFAASWTEPARLLC